MQTEVLPPRMTIEGIVSEPLLPELIGIGIAAAVDAVEVMIALSALQKVGISVGCYSVCRRVTATYRPIALLVSVIGWRGLFPDGGEPLVVDRANLVDTTQSTIGLCAARVVMRGEEPLEMSANALSGCVCKCLLCQTGLKVQ